MSKLYFATTNQQKIQVAKAICSPSHVIIKPVALDIDEIQGEDSELIVRDKVKRAYEQIGFPIVVTDDSWEISALNGFPGPYMKSIDQWFSTDDFLRLMGGVTDRKVTLHQYLAYTDGKTTKIFRYDFTGQYMNEARGKVEGYPNMSVMALDFDKGKTIAEVFEQSPEVVAAHIVDRPDAWQDFVKWYKQS